MAAPTVAVTRTGISSDVAITCKLTGHNDLIYSRIAGWVRVSLDIMERLIAVTFLTLS